MGLGSHPAHQVHQPSGHIHGPVLVCSSIDRSTRAHKQLSYFRSVTCGNHSKRPEQFRQQVGAAPHDPHVLRCEPLLNCFRDSIPKNAQFTYRAIIGIVVGSKEAPQVGHRLLYAPCRSVPVSVQTLDVDAERIGNGLQHGIGGSSGASLDLLQCAGAEPSGFG